MEEDAQQRITFLLQEIDANICAAHRSATQICTTVRRHHQILRQIHDAAQVWRPLFDSFTVQPAASRRPPTTPAPSVSRPRPSTIARETDEIDHATRSLTFSDEEIESESPMEDEDAFKTTTLKKVVNDSVNESLSMSINSERLPAMSRTPYMKAPSSRYKKAPPSTSVVSEQNTNWTPAMSSPPRTDLLTTQQQGNRHIGTPPSAISSIAPASPGINKNLMKMGAFEYTPPRKGRTPKATQAADNEEQSLMSPAMPTFATVGAPESVARTTARRADDEETKGESSLVSPGYRKRKRPGSPSPQRSPHRNESTPTRRPASSNVTPGSLRRKYSVTGDYATPIRPRRSEMTVESIKKASQDLLISESPMTPSFEMPSPLLRTQLKAMTPHTPLSNRLVGANLDVGTTTQETKIQDYDESLNSGEPVPEFQLSLFPTAFQRGIGAVQISTLYSKFQAPEDGTNPARNVDQLAEMLPDYGKERIEILLDTLVSRRLLRPFVVEGIMFWQIPA
ncbi:hypothetical protein Poli38472_003997 [Pythium oligandrum]|uniref:DASH complex subunit ASK1 n=1 Tax=Pythium oligandrum TaxID=41045 RepID=A0A8K1CMF8_PYTOL|nr:hypothetical protein Poli38472_003997 [Pythium oligandrum]|eukprot:TMW66232.1 hypothetical protein Poli38472_003997 [Pythium oligandrum]